MELRGTLAAHTAHRQLVKSPVVTVGEGFKLDLIQNDVPVMLFYKHGNYPWRSLLINSAFDPEGVPRYSDIYLMSSVSESERVEYQIVY